MDDPSIAMVAPATHYDKAPLTEALIDIHVTPSPSDALFDELADRWKAELPIKSAIMQVGFQVDVATESSVVATMPKVGLMLEPDNRLHAVQIRQNGFSFHRRAPYQTFENLIATAKPYFIEFVSAANAEFVTRAALRYTNVVELPLDFKDFSEYLDCEPPVPRKLPQTIVSSLSKLTVQIDDQTTSIITQVINPLSPGATTCTIILDIDVFREMSLSPAAPELWQHLQNLRQIKNDVFESSFTAKAKDIFR